MNTFRYSIDIPRRWIAGLKAVCLALDPFRRNAGSMPRGRSSPRPAIWAVVLFLFIAATGSAGTARAASRTERPFQVQLEWYGLSVGYHVSEFIYVGATRQFGSASNRFHGGHWMDGDGDGHGGHDMHDDDRLYGQDGVTDDEFDYGDRTSIEVRFSPEPFGVYLAVGVLMLEPDKEQVVWDERQRTVGQGNYVTGLRAEIEGKRSTVPALGAGLNHIFAGGLSLGAGFLYGITEPEKPKVDATATSSEVSESDLALFRKRIRDDFQDPPLMIHLAVGYNF